MSNPRPQVTTIALAAAFLLAFVLRHRRIGSIYVIPIAALLVPIEIAVKALDPPADPEMRIWWRMAAAMGAPYGLAAAALGHAGAVFLERRRGA